MPPTKGNDTLVGTTGGDTIDALAGDDSIDAKTRPTAPGSDSDLVDGNTGIDTLIVDCSAETQSVQLGTGSSPTFAVRSTSGNFYVDAYNMEKVKFTGGSGNDLINTGDRGGFVRGGGGIDHWVANLGFLFTNVVFTLGSTTSLAAAEITAIQDIERISFTTGAGDDTITGGAQADSINTGAGNDRIDAKTRPTAEPAVDVVDGGDDFDTLVVNASTETKAVQLGTGFSPSYTVRSDSGNFYIDAYAMEAVEFTSGSGNDFINTGGRGGKIDGGSGTDHWTADLSALTGDVVFTLGTTKAIAEAGLTSILGIERLSLTTGSGDDTIISGAQADTINTGAGDDSINPRTRPSAAAAIDTVDGGKGIDTLVIDASAETKAVQLGTGFSPVFTVRSDSGNFYVDAYNMELINFTGGTGDDTINSGDHGLKVNGGAGGIDHWIADLSAVSSAIDFRLGTTTSIAAAGLTSIGGIDKMSLTTGGGADTIVSGAQADNISTGNGNDVINVRTRPSASGAIDTVDGGNGIDTLVVDASAETESVTVGAGFSPTFSVRSTSNNFYIDAYAMEKLKFTGGTGGDTVNGLANADSIATGRGKDIVVGNDGNDVIDTDTNTDYLRGGRGADKLSGGTESDIFDYDSVLDSSVFNGQIDTITDFQAGLDKVDLTNIDANNFASDGNQAFVLKGAFTGVAGELRSVAGMIEGDVNGDGVADIRILLSNGATAGATDIFL